MLMFIFFINFLIYFSTRSIRGLADNSRIWKKKKTLAAEVEISSSEHRWNYDEFPHTSFPSFLKQKIFFAFVIRNIVEIMTNAHTHACGMFPILLGL